MRLGTFALSLLIDIVIVHCQLVPFYAMELRWSRLAARARRAPRAPLRGTILALAKALALGIEILAFAALEAIVFALAAF